jgi:hypothetical protein
MQKGVTASDLMWMNVGAWKGLHEKDVATTWNLGTVTANASTLHTVTIHRVKTSCRRYFWIHTGFQQVARRTRAFGSLTKFELFDLQKYCAALIGSSRKAFRDNQSSPSSRTKQSTNCLTFEGGTVRMSRNVCH